MAGFSERLKHAWNAFSGQQLENEDYSYGPSAYGPAPSRSRTRVTNERSIISSIYTRLSIDVAQAVIKHVRLDDQGRYIEDIDSSLNECLTVDPNIDQTPRQLRQDIAMTLFDKGVMALVPVDTTLNPKTSSFDVKSIRVGEIVQWYPEKVKCSVFNQAKQIRQDVTLDKKFVAIVENPLYGVMNEPNSTLQRLQRKLNILDAVDEASGSGKLDIIVQVPYTIKSEARRQAAAQRREDIEFQLKGSQYGIAYVDATEKIIQLNRPAENNLLAQVQYLTEMLYSQLGLTPEVMNGTADEAAMLNYHSRTIEPILQSIVEAMRRAFLTKTARSQMQSIQYFRDPFKLVPVSQLAEIADKFTRNEILTSNEIRSVVGFKPAKDKGADKLQNSNMPQPGPATPPTNDQTQQTAPAVETTPKGDSQNGS